MSENDVPWGKPFEYEVRPHGRPREHLLAPIDVETTPEHRAAMGLDESDYQRMLAAARMTYPELEGREPLFVRFEDGTVTDGRPDGFTLGTVPDASVARSGVDLGSRFRGLPLEEYRERCEQRDRDTIAEAGLPLPFSRDMSFEAALSLLYEEACDWVHSQFDNGLVDFDTKRAFLRQLGRERDELRYRAGGARRLTFGKLVAAADDQMRLGRWSALELTPEDVRATLEREGARVDDETIGKIAKAARAELAGSPAVLEAVDEARDVILAQAARLLPKCGRAFAFAGEELVPVWGIVLSSEAEKLGSACPRIEAARAEAFALAGGLEGLDESIGDQANGIQTADLFVRASDGQALLSTDEGLLEVPDELLSVIRHFDASGGVRAARGLSLRENPSLDERAEELAEGLDSHELVQGHDLRGDELGGGAR